MKKEYILYGIKKFQGVIGEIRDDFIGYQDLYAIELILSEAVSNAFKHGNKCNINKPIYIRLKLQGNILIMEIEDSGSGFAEAVIPSQMRDENLLDESGRGLFLINCFADKIQIIRNKIIIEKLIK